MIAGDKGFSAEGSLVCAELRALMVVKTKPAAIKLKIVFAVVFIGNVPNSSCEMFCNTHRLHLLDEKTLSAKETQVLKIAF
jgi:hypothetical protein